MALGQLLRGARRRRPAGANRPRPPALVGGALAVLGCLAAAGCGPPAAGTRAGAPVLYVANSRDGTLTRIDPADGRALGPPVPAGVAPGPLAVGPAAAVLVQSVTAAPGVSLMHVVRGAAGWRGYPLPLEPGAQDAVLAGSGRHAAVVYRAPADPAAGSGGGCRVVRVDVAHGQVGPARDVCAGRTAVVGLAMGADGAVVYLALWRRPATAQPCDGPTGSRVVALRLDTGHPVASAPLDGVPGPLLLAPGPAGRGQRLYAAEALPGDADVAASGAPPGACAEAGYGHAFEGARAWRVWDLDAATLTPAAEHAVPYPPRALAATPDGGDAFVLAGRATVLRLLPAGGPVHPFATLPDQAFGLAATDDQVFTLDVFGDRVWSLDRTRGRLLRTIPTGRSPLGLALTPSDSADQR